MPNAKYVEHWQSYKTRLVDMAQNVCQLYSVNDVDIPDKASSWWLRFQNHQQRWTTQHSPQTLKIHTEFYHKSANTPQHKTQHLTMYNTPSP